MKKGLVMEGGAMRGLFTCGVIDVMLENGLVFDGAIGTSAGAAFGCNYKSKQIGRALRYNMKYCTDDRYVSIKSLIKTGDIYGVDFCYNTLPNKLDIFDRKTFTENPMEFYVTATNVETGKAEYYKCTDGMEKDLKWIQASASMPMVSNIVEVDGYKLLDGGIADSIPLMHMEELGYDRNVVVMTRPFEYRKDKNKFVPIAKIMYKKYPNMVKAIADRHIYYNETVEYILEKERAGELYVIRPPKPLNVGGMEKNPDELKRVYDIGRHTALMCMDEVKKFLEK